MTGFGVDLSQLGALGSKVSGAADSLTEAVKAITGAASGDLGSTDLNDAITQLLQQTGEGLGGLASDAASVATSLVQTATNYNQTDQSNASTYNNLTNSTSGN